MNTTMSFAMVDEVAALYKANEDTHTATVLLSLLVRWYDFSLRKDKFVRKHVKDTVYKLNSDFAQGYFESGNLMKTQKP
jgi:hypothetical protein